MRGSKLTLTGFLNWGLLLKCDPKAIEQTRWKNDLRRTNINFGWLSLWPPCAGLNLYISGDDDMCWVARGSDPAYFSSAKSDLWHSASPPGFFHGYEGNSAIRGTFYHLHTLNVLAKRYEVVDGQQEEKRNAKYRKKYTITRYQINFWSAIRPLWLA